MLHVLRTVSTTVRDRFASQVIHWVPSNVIAEIQQGLLYMYFYRMRSDGKHFDARVSARHHWLGQVIVLASCRQRIPESQIIVTYMYYKYMYLSRPELLLPTVIDVLPFSQHRDNGTHLHPHLPRHPR